MPMLQARPVTPTCTALRARPPTPPRRSGPSPLTTAHLDGPAVALGIRRERRSKRGTTFIEATLVITTLVILWAGGRYLGKMTAQRLDAQASARDCGWRIALAACAEE